MQGDMSRGRPRPYLFGGFNIMFEQFKELLIEEFQVDEDKITLDAELSGDLAINSIELAELILRCEEEFGIDIQEEEMHKFVTVGDVVDYLNTLEK